jgi:hypothetical protein
LQLLLPPTITTLEEAILSLLDLPETPPMRLLSKKAIAEKSIALLAWRQAAERLTLEELRAVQQAPEGLHSSEIALHVARLAERLACELGGVGLSIEEVLLQHAPFFPESAEREEPRWKALAHLQKEYQKTLSHWGYVDRSEMVKKKLEYGSFSKQLHVVVAGVVETPPHASSFFEKVAPEVLIIAPERHALGFDLYGRMLPSYWLEHPAEVADALLISCERSRDQASEVWQIVTNWREHSCDAAIAIIAPETEALPFLREAGAAIDIKTRWAGGRSFQGGSLSALLTSLKNFLDRPPCTPPSLSAVTSILRHPIAATRLTASLGISSERLLRELDDWEREHLARFLDKKQLDCFHQGETLGVLLGELEKRFCFGLEAEPLSRLLCEWRELLLYLLEQERLSRSELEEHFFLTCFEKLLLCIEELERLTTTTDFLWRSSDLLAFLLELLCRESIPELEQPEAVEIIGWLEAIAEDRPLLVLTSVHEGAIPISVTNDPLLSEHLCKRLGLRSSQQQLARDHYYLQSIVASRQEEGGVAIIAPRYNGRGEPVRPSRLLLQGCSDADLPSRVVMLTQRQSASPLAASQQQQRSLFSARPIERGDMMKLYSTSLLETLNVTALRTYLYSPRLFYLQHILKLKEILETPVEMTSRQFGVLLHRVLGAFSMEPSLKQETRETAFVPWLERALQKAFQWQFGWNASPAVASQQGELLRALKGFAQAEERHRQEGWITVAAEGEGGHRSLLQERRSLLDQDRSLLLQGRIDRLDWHPEKRRWLLLDYKTSHRQEWRRETPNHTHFQQHGETTLWRDLQLPLYLKLAPQLEAVGNSRLPLPTIENTDLCYFQLPIEPEAARITEPFAAAMIEPAWREAERIIQLILAGEFEEVGKLDVTVSPTFRALCGITSANG